MPDPIWKPVAAEDDGLSVEITYRNELGEEYVHVTGGWGVEIDSSNSHALCWDHCYGDWPGCKHDCPLFTGPITEWLKEQKRYETMPPENPFSFLLHRSYSIDDNNFYVEAFDTLDGSHWEISVDVSEHILDLLDNETQHEQGC